MRIRRVACWTDEPSARHLPSRNELQKVKRPKVISSQHLIRHGKLVSIGSARPHIARTAPPGRRWSCIEPTPTAAACAPTAKHINAANVANVANIAQAAACTQ